MATMIGTGKACDFTIASSFQFVSRVPGGARHGHGLRVFVRVKDGKGTYTVHSTGLCSLTYVQTPPPASDLRIRDGVTYSLSCTV